MQYTNPFRNFDLLSSGAPVKLALADHQMVVHFTKNSVQAFN